MLKTSLAALGVALAFVQPAQATVVVKTIDFTTTNFIDVNGSAVPPVSSVSGSFTVSFDTAVDALNNTADIIVNSFTGPTVDSPFGFTYYASLKYLFFGGTQNGPNYVGTFSNDYVLALDLTDLDTPRAITCADTGISCASSTGDANVLASGYTVGNSSSVFFQDARVTTIGSVPEPATWATMILGFGLVGGALRRRRKVAFRFA